MDLLEYFLICLRGFTLLLSLGGLIVSIIISAVASNFGQETETEYDGLYPPPMSLVLVRKP